MKKIVAACVLLVSMSGMAFAQTASREKVIEMMNALHSKQRMLQLSQMMKTQVMTAVLDNAKSNPKQQMTEQQIESLRQYVEDDAFTPKMMDEMLDAFIPIYQKYYTDAEISEILLFYNSPTGQKMLMEGPKMMAEGMSAIQPMMKAMMADMQKKAEERAKAGAAATQ